MGGKSITKLDPADWAGADVLLVPNPATTSRARRRRVQDALEAHAGIALYHDPMGRPRADGVYVSVSHVRGLSVVALSSDYDIGIDAEDIAPFPKSEVPWILFSESEAAALDAAPDFWPAFFRLWTRKEALAKLSGRPDALDWAALDTTAPNLISREIRPDGTRIALSLAYATR